MNLLKVQTQPRAGREAGEHGEAWALNREERGKAPFFLFSDCQRQAKPRLRRYLWGRYDPSRLSRRPSPKGAESLDRLSGDPLFSSLFFGGSGGPVKQA